MGAYDDDGEDPRNHMSRRMRHVINDQGHAVALILCAIVLLFVCLPLFLVDDLFYVHKSAPEARKRVSMPQATVDPVFGNRSQRLDMRQNYTIAHPLALQDDDRAEEDLPVNEIHSSKLTSRPNVSASDPQVAIGALRSDDENESALGEDDDIAALKLTRAKDATGLRSPT